MFGSRLRAAREAAGLTLVELARRVGVSQGYLSKVERGEKAPVGPRLIRALGDAVGGDYEGLVGEAVDGRGVIGFALGPDGAGAYGRPVLKLLWARYRTMGEVEWERLRRALESDFPEGE